MSNCLIIPVLTGLFSALFGYLLGRLLTTGGGEKYENIVAELKQKLNVANDAIAKQQIEAEEKHQKNLLLESNLANAIALEKSLKEKIATLENKLTNSHQTNDLQFKNKIAELERKLATIPQSNEPALKGRIAELENKLANIPANQDVALKAKIVELEQQIQLAARNEIAYKQHITILENKLANVPTSNEPALRKKIEELERFIGSNPSSSNESVLKQKLNELEHSIMIAAKNETSYKQHIAMLEQKLSSISTSNEDEYKTRIAELERLLANAKAEIEILNAVPFDSKYASEVYGRKIVKDDLKIVEGIGPKIEELFHKFGIKTWKNLADTSVERCQEILDSEGERYRVHNPGTWPRQCELAFKGRWEELLQWQENMKGGVEVK